MDFSSSVVADLSIIMIIGAVVAYGLYRLKQPLMIGYLIAGMIIGLLTHPFRLISQPEVFSAHCRPGSYTTYFRDRLEISSLQICFRR